jgi:hypothetical protein
MATHFGKVIGDTAADDTSANYDYVSGFCHVSILDGLFPSCNP